MGFRFGYGGAGNCPNRKLSYIWIMMYVDDLLRLFDTAVESFPELRTDRVRADLRSAIEDRRYDLQDESMIEVILKQDSRELLDSFASIYESALSGFDDDALRAEFKDGDGAIKEAIRIYIASLEHVINYYHTSLIGKHFSST